MKYHIGQRIIFSTDIHTTIIGILSEHHPDRAHYRVRADEILKLLANRDVSFTLSEMEIDNILLLEEAETQTNHR